MVKFKYFLVDIFRHTHNLRDYSFLMNSQWWDTEKLVKYQLRKLKLLINHAYENVPYYGRLFDSKKLKPSQINSLKDLEKIPILTKDIIKENFSELIALNYRKFGKWKKSTGGSTGKPLLYYMSNNALSSSTANGLRAWSVGKYKPGDKIIYLGGPSLLGNIDIKRKIYFYLNNFVPMSSFNLDGISLEEYSRKLMTTKAKFMYAYSSSAVALADFVIEEKINDISLNAVFTTAEMLYPEGKSKVTKAFNCKVYNMYGANDGGLTSFECELQDGFHQAAERAVLEVTTETGEQLDFGKEGIAVTTDLTNYTMPFIRYKLDDIISLEQENCKCNRGLPLIKDVKGRISEFIIDRNNKRVHGEFFSHLFGGFSWIRQFQVVQEDLEELLILLKINNGIFDNNDLVKIKSLLEKKFEAIKIELKLVEHIDTLKNGKHRFIMSKVAKKNY